MKEIWKIIQNTTYQVSSQGRVRKSDGTILQPGISKGYEHVGLILAGKKYNFKIHYLVCLTFNGVKPVEANCVRHLNGNKRDNYSCNLRWGTNKENAQDTIVHGRQICGFDHPNVHITKQEARIIRNHYFQHMKNRKKAKNGFIKELVKQFPHLSYKCVYKAAQGAYDAME